MIRSCILLGVMVLGLQVPCKLFGQSAEENESENVKGASVLPNPSKGLDLKQASQLIVRRTNDFREKHERDIVKVDESLTKAAQYFADYMARTDKYGHTADGQRPSERAEEHGYSYCIVLENIAYQYSSEGFMPEELARRFEQGWEESPGHRKNKLDRAVTETGVAISQSEESGHFYAVQMFGRPESMQIEFSIENKAEREVSYKIGDREFSLPPRYTRTHQRCRPMEVVVSTSEGKTESLSPSDGDEFVVQAAGDRLKITER